MDSAEPTRVRIRNCRVGPYVSALAQLVAVALKEAWDVASLAEGIHDVRTILGMSQTESVTNFMKAREIHENIVQQWVLLAPNSHF